MHPTALVQNNGNPATAGNVAHNASSTLAAGNAPTTSSMDINNGIIDGEQPSRKRMKPSSSSGETTPAFGSGTTATATVAAATTTDNTTSGFAQPPSSATKRRAPGILSTALGWARSQAADLATFQETKAAEGPDKPLPALPLPTRRLAAAHHDMVKAAGQRITQRRGGGGGAGTTINSIRSVRTATFHPNQQQQPQQQQQHPVSVAFSTGTDPQLASVLDAELTRLGDLAQADPAKYAALAEECKLWAAGSTASVAGLTTTDLEKAQNQLKAAMQHVPFSGTAGGTNSGYRGGTATTTTTFGGVPMPDPRASSYFIQPGSGGGNATAAGQQQQQQQQQHQLFNNYSQYYHPQQGHVLSRLNNNSSFATATTTTQGYQYHNNISSGTNNGGGGTSHRYPRRSSRARNAKRDDVYLTLDSDEEEGDIDREDDVDHDDRCREDGNGGGGGGGHRVWASSTEWKRGPGRPRKTVDANANAIQQHYPHHQQQQQQNHQNQQQQQQFSPNLMLLHPVHQRLQNRMTPPSISPAGVPGAGGGGNGSLAFFSPQLGDVLSPFAQFLFEHSPDGHPPVSSDGVAGVLQGGQALSAELTRNTAIAGTISGANDPAAAAAAGEGADATTDVDYAALDEFISGLNFTNDAVLGSPSAMAMLAGVKAAAAAAMTEAEVAAAVAAAGITNATAGVTAAAVPAGMIPTTEAGGAIHYTNAPAVPHTATTGPTPPTTTTTTTAAANHHDHRITYDQPFSSASPPPQQQQNPPHAVLPILDLAICKPLETPTVAGMLSLGLSKKSPTPMTSPLLSPTLLALNF
jgi:hypothetical protein